MRSSLIVAAVAALAGIGVAHAAPPATGELHLPAYQKVVLDNGATLVLLPDREVPMVTFQAVVRGGTVSDPVGKEGLASFTAEMLRKGAGERSAGQIAETIDGLGGSLTVDTSRDATTLGLDLLAKDAGVGIALLSDLLMRPTFPAEEVEKLRSRAVDGIKGSKEDPRDVIALYFDRALFGDHPYGRPSIGTEETVATFTREDVVGFHSQWYGADRLIVVVGGDIDPAAMESQLRAALSGWGAAKAPLTVVPAAPRVKGRKVVLVDKPDATQTYFYIGNVGTSRTYHRRVALDLVATIFGGRFTSMLNSALRIDSGLTYGARLVRDRPIEPGEMAMWSYTETGKTKEAVDLALATLAKLHTDGIPDKTLASAKAYLRGQLPPTLETAAQLSAKLASLILYGLPDDEINGYLGRMAAVTPADARAVIAEAMPASDDLVFVLIGNADAIREVAAGYGPVEEKDIRAAGF